MVSLFPLAWEVLTGTGMSFWGSLGHLPPETCALCHWGSSTFQWDCAFMKFWMFAFPRYATFLCVFDSLLCIWPLAKGWLNNSPKKWFTIRRQQVVMRVSQQKRASSAVRAPRRKDSGKESRTGVTGPWPSLERQLRLLEIEFVLFSLLSFS